MGIDAAWRIQCFRRLAGPAFTPLGGPSIYAAWRAQCLRRLANPVFTPLGGPSVFAAWRTQCLRRLAGPVFTPLGGASIYAAWRGQYLRRLADPMFTPLSGRRMSFSLSSKRNPLFAFRASVTTKRGNYTVFIFETLQATSLQKPATTPLGTTCQKLIGKT